MIVILKILTPALFTLLTVIQLVRDWKYHDKRTTRYRKVTRILLWAYIAPVAFSTITIFYDSRESSSTQDKINELIAGKDALLSKNIDLQNEISKYQIDLSLKDDQIKELEIKAKMASRGISSVYDFQGIKRDTGPGSVSANIGAEFEAFQKMRALEKDQHFNELIALCKQQILKTPEWLTPYLFLGVAYANTDNNQLAIKNLEHVVINAPGDPQYARADELLKQLQKQ